MSDSTFASLSSTLLARKGGAKPAMRPQLGVPGKVDGAAAAANLEDLGWNDMGEDGDDAPAHSAPVIQLSPAEPGSDFQPVAAPSPVRDTIERIAAKLETPTRQNTVDTDDVDAEKADTPDDEAKHAADAENVMAQKPSQDMAERKKPASRQSGKRAAFTLRLDADRHLKLRLACTVRNRSAQQLVTDAVDALLLQMPEIELLAAQVARD